MTGNVMEWCEEYFDKYKAYDQEEPEGLDYNF
jgi:formylglycine-generating enzyme required for sulfatase activity